MEAMPRRASCAATMVPEKPAPTMATGASRSNVIVRPLLRIARPRLDLLDVIIGLGDSAAGRVGEPAGDDAVDQSREPGTDQLEPDPDCSRAMLRPAQSE